MNKKTLTTLLRSIADTLKPFASVHTSSSLSWDGNAYVKNDKPSFDTGAMTWHAMLTAIAQLIETQDHDPNEAQKKYLKTLLLGGMGSFHDFFLSPKYAGDTTSEVNKRLDQIRSELFELFKND